MKAKSDLFIDATRGSRVGIVDETARLATGVHARQVRFVRGKAKFCSPVATVCGVTTYSCNGLSLRPHAFSHWFDLPLPHPT